MGTDILKPNYIKPRWSKVISDLWGDKTRTALVVASIAVGVFAIGTIITTFVILNQDFNSSYAATNPANIGIWTDPFREDLIRVIEKVPGVDQVEGRQVVPIRTRRGTENWQGATLIGVDDFENSRINQVGAVEGSLTPGRNEIMFSEDLLNSTDFQVGDAVEIEFPDGSSHDLTVVGLVTDQQSTRPTSSTSSNGFVTRETLRGLGTENYFNRLLITVEGDGGDEAFISQVTNDIEDKLESHNRGVYQKREALSNEHPMADMIFALLGVLGALGVLITILSASLIINTLNALLAQQMRQIGVMKLIGARSLQILGMYLGLITNYSVIALVLAVPFSALAGYALANLAASLLGAVLMGFRIIPAAVVVQAVVAFMVPLSAGFFPVNKGAKTNVRRAISSYQSGGGGVKQGFFTRSGLWVRWISRPILLSFRNTFRKKGRLFLTIFTLTIAGAIFIGVFNVRASMDNVMNQLYLHFMGDVTINFSQPYHTSKVVRDLLAVPGITDVEGWGGASGQILDRDDEVVADLMIVAPPQDTQLLDLQMAAGRWLLPDEEKAMVISDVIYDDYPDLEPGDSLIVEIPGNREEEWEVVGIYSFVSMLGDPMAYANFDYVADKVNLPNQASSFRLITEPTNQSVQSLIQEIDRQLEDQGYAVQSIEVGEVQRESITSAVNLLILFLLLMALLTASVGSIGLMGTMSINVLERTREIGVMRTIGAVDGVVMQSVIIEGLVIGLITWILAIGLSYPISSVLLDIVSRAISDSEFTLVFTSLGVFVWLGVVVVLSIIASVMPARNAASLTINEVLAYE